VIDEWARWPDDGRDRGGGVGPIVPSVGKIAVLRANAIGDFIFALPALDALRAAYPQAEISILGSPWQAGFVPGRTAMVDRVLVVPTLPGVTDGAPDHPRVSWADLKAERFDLALQWHGGGRHSNPLMASLGAGLTAGLRDHGAPPLDRWIRYVHYQPEIFRYLDAAALVGAAPTGYRPRLLVTKRDRDELARVPSLTERPFAVLHPGATDVRRRWAADRFASVGDSLAKTGLHVLITGTTREQRWVEYVASTMRQPGRLVVDGLSLGGLLALLARAAVVVANDTGPLHMAMAVDSPTVGLYWVGNVINSATATRDRHRAFVSWITHCVRCGTRLIRDTAPGGADGGRCRHRQSLLGDITAAEVSAAALELASG
jgi:ADP-heptose:LPS heptosyltransferase